MTLTSNGKLNVTEIAHISSGSLELGNGDEKQIFDASGATIQFQTADTERLRISGNNLHLNGGTDARIQLNSGGAGANSTSNDTVHIRGDSDNMKLMVAANGNYIFENNGTEQLRVDTSGNLQIVGGNQMTQGLFFYNGGNTHLLSGIRNKSNSSYNDSGGLEFLTSGTSNAAESVKMSIDTQGNVGIGTTSPDQTLTVSSSSGVAAKFLGESGPHGLNIGGNDVGF